MFSFFSFFFGLGVCFCTDVKTYVEETGHLGYKFKLVEVNGL